MAAPRVACLTVSSLVGCKFVHHSAKKKHGDYLDANSCKLTDVSVANSEFHGHLATTPNAKDGDDSIAMDIALNVKMP